MESDLTAAESKGAEQNQGDALEQAPAHGIMGKSALSLYFFKKTVSKLCRC